MTAFFRSCLMVSLAWLALSSCQIDQEAPSVQTQTNLLINHPWRICCQTINPAIRLPDYKHPQTDLQAIRPACDRDDILFFASHSRFEFLEGPTTCRSKADSIINVGDWQLTGSPDSLQLHLVDREGDYTTYQILHLDSSLMVRQYQYVHKNTIHIISEMLKTVPK